MDEAHPCDEIVINIWQYILAPALLFYEICYGAAKIAHLRASFLQERKLDMRHVFHVYIGKVVCVFFPLSLSLLMEVKYPADTPAVWPCL